MIFSLQSQVRDLTLHPEQVLPFSLNADLLGGVSVSVDRDVESMGYDPRQYCRCVAEVEVTVDPGVERAFDYLRRNELPPGSDTTNPSLSGYIVDGKLRSDVHVSPGVLPSDFLAFVDPIYRRLADLSQRAIKVLRWRLRGWGTHNPVLPRLFLWSEDRSVWRPVYAVAYGYGETRACLPHLQPYLSEITALVAAGADEPVGHELRREAYHLRISNPRAAIIIGGAAAETAVKHCVRTLVPESDWLLENMPSPDIARLVRNYLPEVARVRSRDAYWPVHKLVHKWLVLGVEARNKLVHTGRIPDNLKEHQRLLTDQSPLKQYLWSVEQLLWTIDYTCGADWAARNIWDPKTVERMLTPRV